MGTDRTSQSGRRQVETGWVSAAFRDSGAVHWKRGRELRAWERNTFYPGSFDPVVIEPAGGENDWLRS